MTGLELGCLVGLWVTGFTVGACKGLAVGLRVSIIALPVGNFVGVLSATGFAVGNFVGLAVLGF